MPELVFRQLYLTHPVPARILRLCITSAEQRSAPLPPPPFAPNPVSAPVTPWSRRRGCFGPTSRQPLRPWRTAKLQGMWIPCADTLSAT